MVIVPCVLVIELANEELLLVTLESILVILPASEELVVAEVEFVVVMLAAKEELLAFTLLCSPSIFNAADALFVVTVELREITEEFSDADAA